MPLSVAAPLLKTKLSTDFKNSRNKFKSQSKIAFKEAMTKFKEESAKAKPNQDGLISDVFTPAIEAASEVFMNQMDQAYGDLFENLGETIAVEVDKYVKQALITVPPGQLVVGAGGGPAPVAGSVTTPGIATIA